MYLKINSKIIIISILFILSVFVFIKKKAFDEEERKRLEFISQRAKAKAERAEKWKAKEAMRIAEKEAQYEIKEKNRKAKQEEIWKSVKVQNDDNTGRSENTACVNECKSKCIRTESTLMGYAYCAYNCPFGCQ